MNLTQFSKSSSSSQPHLFLIGNPVGHSLSPLMHNTAAGYYGFELKYHAVKVEPSELGMLATYLNNEHLKGVNVTLPYKQRVLDFVDQLDSTCRQIGALNTVAKEGGQLVGYNTDIIGFCEPLAPYQAEIEDTRAVVFGTGGAAQAIIFGLQDIGVAEIVLVSRNPQKVDTQNWPPITQCVSYDVWSDYADGTSLFVNATPLGMAPNVSQSPVKESEVSLLSHKICYDIVYKPVVTQFLQDARTVNARTIGGLEMLIQQGSRSFELWTGNPFPTDEVRNILKTNI